MNKIQDTQVPKEDKKQDNNEAKKDTSRDRMVPDIKPEALWDGRRIMPFRTLDSPTMITVTEADMLDDSDYVLGVSLNSESRAYPTRYLWWHHAINDHIGQKLAGGEVPIVVTYCSVCNTGICYDPTIDGKPVMLDFYGLYNGVVTLCERETQSVFLQAEGRFVTGELSGTTLKALPVLDTTWGDWKRLHPDTLVMSPDTPYSRFYSPKDHPEPRGYDQFPAPFFHPTVTRGDLRLPPFDKVLGVTISETPRNSRHSEKIAADPLVQRRAYSLAELQKKGCVVNDTLSKTVIAVFLDPDTMTAVAVSRKLDGKTLRFETKKQADGKTAFFDRETHTRWNIEGKAEEGPLAGKTLDRVENHLSQWYGWSAAFPDASIYGHKEKPQPGNPFDTAPAKPDRPQEQTSTATDTKSENK